ncbi:MAG: poly-A polymerase [Leptospira sp.]|nr:MAG: poly-A polymerase [Leptospira sp.]
MPNVIDYQLPLHLIPKIEFDNLIFISQTLHQIGEQCLLVGGSVRDLVLGKKPHEYDLTTSALPETIKSKFKRVFDTGILHGTVTIVIDKLSYEITTYRTEQGFTDGRRPDSVKFGATLDEDLERRDFTINALAYDFVSQKLIDNHNGLQDIQNQIIRTIGDPIARFTEDGLRPIRGIRFASTLGFTICSETEAAFNPTSEITSKVAVERFVQELQKILLSTSPRLGLQKMIEYQYFPLFTSYQPKDQPNWDLEKLFEMAPKECLGLIWAIAKEICFSETKMTLQKNLFRELKLSTAIEREALLFGNLFPALLSYSSKSISNFELKANLLSPIKQFYQSQNSETLPSVWKFLIDFFQNFQSTIADQISRIIANQDPLVLADLAVNGEWIKKIFPQAQGKEIGTILRAILEFIWENPENNSEKQILVHLNSLDSLIK